MKRREELTVAVEDIFMQLSHPDTGLLDAQKVQAAYPMLSSERIQQMMFDCGRQDNADRQPGVIFADWWATLTTVHESELLDEDVGREEGVLLGA